jgi:uncharacterized protein (TIGR02266 family)
MADDRRSAPRASLSGVRATYEGAGGDPQEAEVTNLGAGGLFLRTDTPLSVGKRVALDLHVSGEAAPWSALGRIIWTRTASDGPQLPAGMGVKLIDVDEPVVAAIERLVRSREPTEPGMGERAAAAVPVAPILQAPPRERTMLGVGSPLAPRERPGPPRVEPRGPERVEQPGPDRVEPPEPEGLELPPPEPIVESTPVTPEPALENSLAIELVAKKADSNRAAAELPEEPIRIPKNRGRGGLFLLFVLLIAAAGGTAYAFRDRLPSLWARARAAVGHAIERFH